MLWFWQMEGKRWNLDGRSFNVAWRAWKRLAATKQERASESLARYHRADAALHREAEAEQQLHREEQAQQQRRQRVSEAAVARNRVRAASAYARSEQRDPDPRFAMLHALRRVAHVAYWEQWEIGYPEPLPLDDGEQMMAEVITATGSSNRPPWADW